MLLLGLSQTAKSAHFVSGEMYWNHIGNRVFDVYVVYYNECTAYVTDFPFSLVIEGTNGSFNKAKDQIRYDTVKYYPETCGGPACASYKIFIRSEGRFRVNLTNDTSSTYTLSIDDCCRYNNLTNLDLTGTTGQRLFAKMNLAGVDSQYWSSPRFLTEHQFTASTGGLHQISFMADDTLKGLDSVAYELFNPASGANPVTFNAGFSYTSPLTYLGYPSTNLQAYGAGFKLDPANGQLVYSPQLSNEGTVTAVKVKSFRKQNGQWVLSNEIMRDITLLTLNPAMNKFPYFPEKLEDVQFCDTTDTYYAFSVADSNVTDSISINILGKIPEYTIHYLGQSGINRNFKIQFHFDSADWLNDYYYFVIHAGDERCTGTTMGMTQHGLKMYMRKAPDIYQAITPTINRSCNDLNVAVYGWANSGSRHWIVNSDTFAQNSFRLQPQEKTWYYFRFEAEHYACRYSFIDSVYWDSLYHFSGNLNTAPLQSCVNQQASFNWDISGGLDSNQFWINKKEMDSSFFNYQLDSNQYLLEVRNNSGCSADTLLQIALYPELANTTKIEWDLCEDNSQHFYIPGNSAGGAGVSTFTWLNTIVSDSFYVNQDTLSRIPLHIEDSIGCSIEDTINIRIRPRPHYVLRGNATLCYSDSFRLWLDHNIPTSQVAINWGDGFDTTSHQSYKPLADSTVYFILKDTGYCSIYDTVSLHYYPGRYLGMQDSLLLCDYSTGSIDYHFSGIVQEQTWFGEGSSRNTVQYAVDSDTAGEWTIYLELEDADGCLYRDSCFLYRQSSPQLHVNAIHSNWCEDDSVFNLMDLPAQKYGIWNINAVQDSLFNPAQRGPGDHIIHYTLDSGICQANWIDTLRIRKLPQAIIDLKNAVGPAPLNVTFNAAIVSDTAYTFYWDFGLSGNDTSSQPHINQVYSNKGFYSPRVYLSTAYCSNNIQLDSAIQVLYGVGIQAINTNVKAWPNPGTGIYRIEYNKERVEVKLVRNASGQSMHNWTQEILDDVNILNLIGLPAGVYMIELELESGDIAQLKIIHQP